MDVDMKHGHKLAAWPLKHWHAEWTWTGIIDMDKQAGLGLAAGTWTCSRDLNTLYGLEHAARARKYSTGMHHEFVYNTFP